MKIITTTKEFTSTMTLVEACFNSVPSKYRSAKTTKQINELTQIMRDAANPEELLKAAMTFNEKFREENKIFDCYMDHRGDIVLEFNEDKIVEVVEVITDEVDTLAGIAVTMVGLLMTFGSRLKKMAKKIKTIANA